MMDECLRLGCAAPFEGVHADHLTVERSGDIPVGVRREACLLFTVHGILEVRGDGELIVLKPNEALLVEGLPQVVVRHSSAVELYLLRFRRIRLPRGAPRRRVNVPDHVAVLRPARLTHLLRRLVDETRQEVPSRAVLHHLVVLALCELARSSRAVDAAVSDASLESIASRVDAFIAAHYHEPIATPLIAHELHYNPDYLERAYHLERRISIREAVHARRIREARAQLILQATKGVAEIAALCGYADAGYFRRVFKRATNMTPHGYRRLNAAAPDPASSALGAGVHSRW
jgi:AraC-like DNA-binding protein